MKLPLLTPDGLLWAGSRLRPSQDAAVHGGVAPSYCTYGPCAGGVREVQCCDSEGCATTYVRCTVNRTAGE